MNSSFADILRQLAISRGSSPALTFEDQTWSFARLHERSSRSANALMAAGDRDGSAEALLHIIAADREWNDGAAKARLLEIFALIGLEDPWVAATRRKLSAILFG